MSSCSGQCSSCGEKGKCGDEKLNQVLDRIQHKIMVLSGKGGVGKSSVAASLAVSLAKKGFRVGLLDLDFHGPSQPTLFGVAHQRMDGDDAGMNPMEVAGGIKLVSVGLLLEDENQAIIWRGPAKIGVLKQLIEEVKWDDLDYLILDFPPGTGDEVLSACQMITGDKQAVIVTTPQELSMADCRKCLDFCQKLNLKVGGIVENMGGFTCPDCGHTHPLFSNGGGERLAKAYSIPLIAQLPLDPKFMEQCDAGNVAEALGKAPAIGSAMDIAAEILSR